MQGDPLVFRAGQPGADVLVLVGGLVVQHHVQGDAWVGGGDLLQELQEFLVAVAGLAGVGDLAGSCVQGGEQTGDSVPGVSWVCRSGMPGRSGRIGWVRSSAWHCDFSSTHTTTAFSGGFRYSPTTSPTLASSSGSVDNLNPPDRCGCRQNRRHTRVMESWLTGIFRHRLVPARVVYA